MLMSTHASSIVTAAWCYHITVEHLKTNNKPTCIILFSLFLYSIYSQFTYKGIFCTNIQEIRYMSKLLVFIYPDVRHRREQHL